MSIDKLTANINQFDIPKHVAIIMDGNGRWAKSKLQPRLKGHSKGVSTVKKIVKAASKINLEYLTLYVFSDENWKRPKIEIKGLMNLLALTIEKELEELEENNVRLKHIGSLKGFPSTLKNKLAKAIKKTENNKGLTLSLAIGYGGKKEIINAVNAIVSDVLSNKLKEEMVSESVFENYLDTNSIPDPELLIRTSGEYRISNFLLWQVAYSELYFTDKLWPEFDEEDFYKAIKEYQNRERRFGLTSDQLKK